MRDKLIGFLSAGTQTTDDDTVRRHIIFSNIIFLSMPLAYAAYTIIDIQNFDFFDDAGNFHLDRIANLAVFSVGLLCYQLNRIGYHYISRSSFLIFWPLLNHVLPIIIQHSPPDYYYAFPVGIIFHSTMIQLSFSPRKEKLFFWVFILINLTMLFFAHKLLQANDPTPFEGNIRNDRYYILDQFLYWILFSLATYYLIYIIEDIIGKLKEAKEIIDDQKAELEAVNEELEQTNHSLSQANDRLEVNVANRTAELSRKNDQLKQYAHYNAHQLRGPYARVRGLFNLISDSQRHFQDPEIHKRLVQSLDELENVIAYIQRAVE